MSFNIFKHVDIYYPGLNYNGRMWVDPFIDSILQLFGIEGFSSAYFIFQLAILFIGTVFLCVKLNASIKEGVIASLCVIVFCVCVLGFDSYLLNLHWFPALTASLINYRANQSIGKFFIAIICSLLWILGSGPLVLFGALLALLMASIPNVASRSEPLALRDLCFKNPYFALFGCALLIGCLIGIPVYEMPDYPGDARVTPISPFTFRGAPSIGPWLNPVTLVWNEYQHINNVYTVKLALFSAIVCCVMLIFRRWSWRTFISLAICLLAIGLESLAYEEVSLYTPFQTLWRLIPGVGISDLPWMLIPFGVIIAFGVGAFCLGDKCMMGILGAMALVVFFSMATNTSLLASPLEKRIELKGPKFALQGLNDGIDYGAQRGTETPIETRRQNQLGFVNSMWQNVSLSGKSEIPWKDSPSGFVIKTFGQWVIDPQASKRKFENLERLVYGKDFSATVSASINAEQALLALDNNANTRWGTSRAQKAGDFFSLEFVNPIDIIRVVLSIKSVPADFPRGIKVLASKDCRKFYEIINYPHWHGPVRWTDKGYPFFGPQSWVILDFPKQEQLSCLKFELQEGHPVYDWSIDEVKLYRSCELKGSDKH